MDGAGLEVPLPHVIKGPYKGNFWTIFMKDMEKLQSEPTTENLEQIIGKHLSRTTNNYGMPIQLLNLRSVLKDRNCEELIPFIAETALGFPDLFPSGTIRCLERQRAAKIELSRKQVGCLLSHMFLCTILVNNDAKTHCGHFTGARAPTGPLTFVNWLARERYGPTHIYLSSLMLFFKDLVSMSEEQLAEKVTFERVVRSTAERDWNPENSSAPILEVVVHDDGRIGDIEQVELDFANKHVGFGTSGTQEELILGTSPETCVIVLFNEVLETNEAVLITGVKRYGDYSGYGNSSRFTGASTQTWNWKERRILAIDAICGPRDQLSDNTFDRELCKAWTGFQAVKAGKIFFLYFYNYIHKTCRARQFPLVIGVVAPLGAILGSNAWSR